MQQTFLYEVAQKLYNRYGEDIQNKTIVLPSRRARLFFSEALSHIVQGGTIWQPEYFSMDDIMSEAASFKVGDKIRIISELYKIYSKHHNEPFDKFYFWGEMLIGDFDLIDKYMIDADMLFCNLYDLKQIEARFPDTETLEVVSRFWKHFLQEESLPEYKQRFLKIWKSLAPIYHELKQRLAELKFAYQGMVYRSAAENLGNNIVNFKRGRHYVIVGFNALSQCEQRVLKFLTANYHCDFYWDYDSYYVDDEQQEAGRFLRQNMTLFPATDHISHDNFLRSEKRLSTISTASNIIQCKYVNKILREISPELLFDKETAIVLTNENLLLPLLHSLPDDKDANGENKLKLNITMGHPIKHTTAYSFVMRLFDLQHNARNDKGKVTFYHVDVSGILNHPYVLEQDGDTAKKLQKTIVNARYIRVSNELFTHSTLLSKIFRYTEGLDDLYNYLIDVIYALSLSVSDNTDSRTLKLSYLAILAENISQVTNSVKQCDIDVSVSIYTSLIKRHLQNVRIPYSGEPLEGLQIMGILETRNLDFKNVIILSMDDDNFPGNSLGNSSYIPYNLKAAYGIPTPEYHEGVYAYYFYRLIQRAERVDMIYCSLADDKSTGERSRYIHQLEFESPHPIKYYNVGVNVAAEPNNSIVIAKEGEVAEILQQLLNNTDKVLSPSAFSPYTSCPLKFYFSKVAKIRTTDSLTDDVDNPMFGKILHIAMQTLYTPLIGIANPKQHLEQILKNNAVEQATIEAINSQFLNREGTDCSDYTGGLILVKDMVIDYIRKSIIPYDIQHNDFTILHLEEDVNYPITLSDGSTVMIGGIADRIDSLDNGCIRVVDYKTGDGHNEINRNKRDVEKQTEGMESLFHNTSSASNYPLQTMLYSMVLHHKTGRNVIPALYAVKNMRKKGFTPYLIDHHAGKTVVDYMTYAQEFEQRLQASLDELFDLSIPFVQCNEEDKLPCQYCDFKILCKR